MMRSQLLKILFPFLGLLILFTGFNTQAADYGYNIGTDELCAVWWTEGTYKIMYQDPVPRRQAGSTPN